MLTRRRVIAAASVLGVSMASSRRVAASRAGSTTAVAFEVPRGACDAHIHIIGNPAEFPMSKDRDYTPPPATADEYSRVLKDLNCDRAIIVTPTVYGNDNSATLSAIGLLGRDRARGVGLVDESTSPKMLDAMSMGGIVGTRLFLHGGGPFNSAAATRRLHAAVELTEKRRWHIQISTPPFVIAALASQLASCPVPLVLDYFAWIQGGVDQPGFDAVLSLMKSGHAYVKLLGPYRLSKRGPDYPDLVPVVRALVAANPDRLLWGSGWPHVDSSAPAGRAKTDLAPNLSVDTVHLFNLFALWVRDPATRRKILVDNPARLYGFQT
jgi:predicted TIM-barrel fold metal-dependent hydrolase